MKRRKKILIGIGLLITAFSASAYTGNSFSLDSDTPKTERIKIESKQSETGSSLNWLSLLALLVGLSGAGAGVFGIIKNQKLEEKLNDFKTQQDKSAKAYKENLASLQNSLDVLRNKVTGLQMVNPRSASSVELQDAAQQTTPMSAPSSQPHREDVVRPSGVSKQLYFSIPRGGIFSNPTTDYVGRKSVYILTDNGERICRYSYIDSPDTALLAKRSLDFLESGCVVSQGRKDNFTKVRTIKPGAARRTATGWTIESKAIVELI